MATRENIASKLKLVVFYKDEAGDDKERSTTFNYVKPDQDPENLIATAEALGSLDAGTLGDAYEITEALLRK